VVNSLKSAAQSIVPSSMAEPEINEASVLPLKLAWFNLQKYIKEEDFAVEFMLRGGMRKLVILLEKEHGGLVGNSLAVSAL
jgi:engulfment/cell motility protein 1